MKVKEFYYKQLEDDFIQNLEYEEYLRDNFSEPTEAEINEMEEDLLRKSSTGKNRIIPNQPLNNIDYYPLSLA